MASQTYILGGNGDTYYLSGSGRVWDGAADDWQAQATSPYKPSANDVTGGVWTPVASPDGQPVEQQTGIQLYADTLELRLVLLQQLRLALSGGATRKQPVLVVQPDGADSPTVYQILRAVVQELPISLNQELRSKAMRALITWTLSPYGGRTTPENVANAVTAGNTGTGSPNNLVVLSSSGAGDLLYDGQPINITIDGSGGPWDAAANQVLVAVVPGSNGRIYTSSSASLATSSTVEELRATINSITATPLYTEPGLTGRVLVRITGASANLEVQARVAIAGGDAFARTPWVQVTGVGGSDMLLDLGPIHHPLYDLPYSGTPTLTVYLYARSTDGAATSGTLAYLEWLSAYSVGETPVFVGAEVTIETFVAQSGRPCLPIPARVRTDRVILPWRGTPPRYIANAYLYVLWRGSGTGGNHRTSETAEVTVDHAPLYATLRGGA